MPKVNLCYFHRQFVLILRIVDVVHKMTYNDYFQALEELKKEDEKLAKEYSSMVMPILRNTLPTLVSNEDIVSAISEFKLPEIWYDNMDEKGEK